MLRTHGVASITVNAYIYMRVKPTVSNFFHDQNKKPDGINNDCLNSFFFSCVISYYMLLFLIILTVVSFMG